MAGPNYFAAVSDMPAPPRAGEAAAAASYDAQARAGVASIQKTTDAIGFLGTTAIDAYKGYKLAELQKEVDDTLNNVHSPYYTGKNAKEKMTGAAADVVARGNMAIAEASSPFEDVPQALVQDFNNQLARINAGQVQGVYTRDQAITRISDAVKRYSADVPGMAQAFRQLAAEQTGISNIDVYGVHTALTARNAADTTARKAEEARIELLKEVARAEGVTDLASITPEMLARHRQNKQREMQVKQANDFLSLQKAQTETTDRVHVQQVYSILEGTLLPSLAKEMAAKGGPIELLATATGPDAHLKGAELANLLRGRFDVLNTNIDSLINNAVNGIGMNGEKVAPMSRTEAAALKKDIKEQIDVYRTALSTAAGRALIFDMAKGAEAGASFSLASFYRNNPAAQVAGATGMYSSLLQIAASVNFDKKMLKERFGTFGEFAAAAVVDVLSDPTLSRQHAGRMIDIAKGGPSDVPGVDPKVAKSVEIDVMRATENAVAVGVTPENKDAFVNYAKAWADKFNPSEKGQWENYLKFFNDSKTRRTLEALPAADRHAIVGRFLQTIGRETSKTTASLLTNKEETMKNATALFPPGVDVGMRIDWGADLVRGVIPVVTFDKAKYAAYVKALTPARGVVAAPPITEAQVEDLIRHDMRANLDKLNGFLFSMVEHAPLVGKSTNVTSINQLAIRALNGENIRWTAPDVPKSTPPSPTPQRRATDVQQTGTQASRDDLATTILATDTPKETLDQWITDLEGALKTKLEPTAQRIIEGQLRIYKAARDKQK